MAAQRIVLTSPWRLGLFVFLLVAGTGFGLIYAYIELLGGHIDLNDAKTVEHAYMILGGVALLGLFGYIAVVTSARPLDRVVRGGKQRDQAIKRLGKITDPREIDLDEFDDEPALMKLLERWGEDAETANAAQLQVAAHREVLSSLTTSIQSAQGGADVSLDPEYETPEINTLVAAINEHSSSVAEQAEERVDSAASASDPEWLSKKAEIANAVGGLSAAEAELEGFVHSVAQQAGRIAKTAQDLSPGDSSGATPTGAVEAAKQNAQQIATIRVSLEALAEEANKLAITMALQISRLGDAGGQMLDTAEEVRSLSTRYQRVATDLRVCETEQTRTLSQLMQMVKDSAGGNVSSNPELSQDAMVLDQNAEALHEVLDRLRAPLSMLRGLTGVDARTSAVASPVNEASSAAVAPVHAAKAVANCSPEPTPQPASPDEERVYEMADFGGVEIGGDNADADVHDLKEFGAIEL